MRYISTRGRAPVLGFADVLLAGLATDGGLYVPETCPSFSAVEIRALRGLPYAEMAARVMRPFLGEAIPWPVFRAMVADAYRSFRHPAVVPLVQLDANLFALELFHGPTLAFKDVAMQLLGRLFDHVLAERGERVTIIGATSGDTGSAAIEAVRDRAAIDIVMLHPDGRVSEVQRRQMTTVLSPNVHNVALAGSFDDCQDLVKAMFNDAPFRAEMKLSAVNSINWARIMAQTAYYFAAALALGAPDRPVAFSVPTGNFGNVYAGQIARMMGLPIERLIVGTNQNDILARFLAGNDMSIRGVQPSHAPSMDIQVSSNFERLLFDLLGHDGAATEAVMVEFRRSGHMPVAPEAWQRAATLMQGFALDDAGMLAGIGRWQRDAGYLLDPHSAVGVAAAAARGGDAAVPVVALATAHPAKFPDAVEQATGARPALPARMADLYQRPERVERLPNDLAAVQAFVRRAVRRNSP
ncbi:MAG: threonine synthase [Alphaproteobacteria bacterium]|nr:threonine synthase [Alphaproteobacteria bacterium]